MKILCSSAKNAQYGVIQFWHDINPMPNGYMVIPDEIDLNDFFKYNGFIYPEIKQIDNVLTMVSYKPNIEAWEEWRKNTSFQPTPDPIEKLEQENALLKQQVQALTEQAAFHEEIFVELAEVLYA